jgi:integrase
MYLFRRTGSTGTTSKYWSARFIGPDGQPVLKTTRRKSKEEAREVAETWERAARAARDAEFTSSQALEYFNEILATATGEELTVPRLSAYIDGWLEGKRTLDKAESSIKRYEGVLNAFKLSLPEKRRDALLASITALEVERFRNLEKQVGKSATTVNFGVKVLRGLFNDARRKGLVTTNPVEAVEFLPEESEERLPFDEEQVKALLLAAKADEEWRGMILFGYHAGLRLTDCAELNWDNIDLADRTLSFRPKKTAKRNGNKETTIALHQDVVTYLDLLPVTDVAGQKLFPTMTGRRSGSYGGLSNAFSALMNKAGIAVPVGVEKKGKGRQFRALGFHSLRHSFISRLANKEISADVRKELVGHSSDEIHRRYTHLDLSLQRKAIGQLSSIL